MAETFRGRVQIFEAESLSYVAHVGARIIYGLSTQVSYDHYLRLSQRFGGFHKWGRLDVLPGLLQGSPNLWKLPYEPSSKLPVFLLIPPVIVP